MAKSSLVHLGLVSRSDSQIRTIGPITVKCATYFFCISRGTYLTISSILFFLPLIQWRLSQKIDKIVWLMHQPSMELVMEQTANCEKKTQSICLLNNDTVLRGTRSIINLVGRVSKLRAKILRNSKWAIFDVQCGMQVEIALQRWKGPAVGHDLHPRKMAMVTTVGTRRCELFRKFSDFRQLHIVHYFPLKCETTHGVFAEYCFTQSYSDENWSRDLS